MPVVENDPFSFLTGFHFLVYSVDRFTCGDETRWGFISIVNIPALL